MLVKYRNELRDIASKKGTPNSWNSVIAKALEGENNYSLAVYNKPEHFGVRLYGFNDDDTPKIMAVLSQFQRRAKHVIWVLLELLDEDKEVIHVIEEKSYIEFLILGEDRFAIHPTIINNDAENSRIVFTIRNSNRKRLAGLKILKKQLGLESQSVILPIIQEQSSQGSLTIL